MVSFTVIWLMHLKALHKQKIEFSDRYQYQVHQARVQLFWLSQQKPDTQSWGAWQLSPQLRQWQEELASKGLAVRVEVNPLALVVETNSMQMARRLNRGLVQSLQEGEELKLLLPTAQAQQSNELWLSRQSGGPVTMSTHLFGNSN